MAVLGEHCSMTERRADDATRDATDWLKCEFMLDRVGEEFDGIITSVTGFGLFVELNDIYVEGLVHITSLPSDYYEFDPVKHRLVGEHSRTVYRLADKVRVKVARVDLDRKRIDFDMAGSVELDHGKGIGKRGQATDEAAAVKPKKKAAKKGVAAKPAEEQPAAAKKKRARKKRSKKKVVAE
jgi:ribonuclease R